MGVEREKKRATALTWNPSLEAPVVIAKGSGLLAVKIEELARSCGITVVNDSGLSEILWATDTGASIPVQTWEAVALIFAFLENGYKEKLF